MVPSGVVTRGAPTGREACNPYYDALPAIVQEYMDKVNAKIGTDYKLFNYYGAADAEHVIIAMGSVNDTIEETIDYLAKQGKKVGVVKVRLYKPFCFSVFSYTATICAGVVSLEPRP